jgi:cyanophycin synthetase
MVDDPVTLRVALDKTLTSRLLSAAGLPVPASLEYRAGNLHAALEFMGRTDQPCVVKPARGTGGGAGTVCGVLSAHDLTSASLWASRTSRDLVIERQAFGDVYRFLLLHGKLVDVIRTGPATVTGDGHHNVYELIAAENRRRLESRGDLGLTILSVDRDCLMTLTRSGRSLKTVPPANERLVVKTATNDSCISDNLTVTQDISPGLIGDVVRAADVTGVQLAGVDVITSDLSQDLETAGGVVIEVNGGPALHRHYHVEDRSRARKVAIPILESLLECSAARTSIQPTTSVRPHPPEE